MMTTSHAISRNEPNIRPTAGFFNRQPNTLGASSFFSPGLIQRSEDTALSDTEAASETPEHEEGAEGEISIVVESDLESGETHVETTQEAEREVSESLTESVEIGTNAEEQEVEAGLRLQAPDSPFSLMGGLNAHTDRTGSSAYPFLRLSVEGESRVFRWLNVEGEANLTFEAAHSPALDAKGRLVFLPEGLISPYLEAGANSASEEFNIEAGGIVNLGHGIRLRAGLMTQIGFTGGAHTSGFAGITIPTNFLE